MTARAQAMPPVRGACPGLTAPMLTGDGLLVRLQPIDTVPLAAFAALCAAARRHGNGVIEVTSRGSIQVRGLSERSAPHFAADVAALGIAADEGVAVHCNALAGIGADELFDAQALAAELRHALGQRSVAARLSPKISVAIDGGGTPTLTRLSADLRLCARETGRGVVLRLGIGGNEENAIAMGNVDPLRGVEAAVRLLDVIARHGHRSRARDIVAADGAGLFRAALTGLLLENASDRDSRLPGNEHDVIGAHALRDGSFACGVGFAFGHADAPVLERLTEAAKTAGAGGFRVAPGRALLAIGIARETIGSFATAARHLGFITRADDPKRRVVACAGAPICGAAYIAARAMAPNIAAAVAPILDDRTTIHVSGCAKGCAHPAPAVLTIVGTPGGCALIADGTARDTPFARVAQQDLNATIARYVRARLDEASHA